jgi:hypothetical protein
MTLQLTRRRLLAVGAATLFAPAIVRAQDDKISVGSLTPNP